MIDLKTLEGQPIGVLVKTYGASPVAYGGILTVIPDTDSIMLSPLDSNNPILTQQRCVESDHFINVFDILVIKKLIYVEPKTSDPRQANLFSSTR